MWKPNFYKMARRGWARSCARKARWTNNSDLIFLTLFTYNY